ncbi:MAG: hypothetical protein F6K23_16580 [Okeania sp. SIO2C9]|uniref:hypothetical protein n=1 Tax=Okeania sp. SIO2C9 TaxID=2607791 RepID=UPI0013BF9B03|nr:hypothetical protein [Okeania sp. SIO2C9]NEQ74508.1 hypothetical protein [Okeania sp. SIO2C9]
MVKYLTLASKSKNPIQLKPGEQGRGAVSLTKLGGRPKIQGYFILYNHLGVGSVGSLEKNYNFMG